MLTFLLNNIYTVAYFIALFFVISPLHAYFSDKIFIKRAILLGEDEGESALTSSVNWSIIGSHLIITALILLQYFDGSLFSLSFIFSLLLVLYACLLITTLLIATWFNFEGRAAKQAYLSIIKSKYSKNIYRLAEKLFDNGIVTVTTDYGVIVGTKKASPKGFISFSASASRFLKNLVKISEYPHLMTNLSLKTMESDVLNDLAVMLSIIEDQEKIDVLNEDHVEEVVETLKVLDRLNDYISIEFEKYMQIENKLEKIKDTHDKRVLMSKHERHKDKVKEDIKGLIESGKSIT